MAETPSRIFECAYPYRKGNLQISTWAERNPIISRRSFVVYIALTQPRRERGMQAFAVLDAARGIQLKKDHIPALDRQSNLAWLTLTSLRQDSDMHRASGRLISFLRNAFPATKAILRAYAVAHNTFGRVRDQDLTAVATVDAALKTALRNRA